MAAPAAAATGGCKEAPKAKEEACEHCLQDIPCAQDADETCCLKLLQAETVTEDTADAKIRQQKSASQRHKDTPRANKDTPRSVTLMATIAARLHALWEHLNSSAAAERACAASSEEEELWLQLNAASAAAERARAAPKVKFTGLTQTLGQLQQPLIGILSQTAGSAGKLWVNPVNFRFQARGKMATAGSRSARPLKTQPRPRRSARLRSRPKTTAAATAWFPDYSYLVG
jgi:hypothetical protein